MSGARVLQATFAAALLCATAPTRAADALEVFVDAVHAGTLAGGDTAALNLDAPECVLGSTKTKQLFCIGFSRSDGGAMTWEGVVIGPGGVEVRAVLDRQAGASADARGDAAGLATITKALAKASWAELPRSAEFSMKDGVRVGAAGALALPGGRTGAVTATGVRASDGAELAIPPVAGRGAMWVDVYGLPGTALLVAAVSDRQGALVDSRFIVSGAAAPPGPETGPEEEEPAAAVSCPPGVWCPAKYGALWPHLDRFCADRFDAGALAAVAAQAESGALGGDELAVLFNAYGALYAYEFKRRTEFNSFFYGAGAAETTAKERAWLPPACRAAFGRYTAKTVPASLRKARDGVKALWRKYR